MLLLMSTMTGCSYQAWYEGVRETRRQECYKLSPGEVQDCLKQVDHASYEQYRREREEMQQPEGDALAP